MLENNTNQKLHDLLISRDFEPEALNNQGKPAASPDQADLFSFNYKGESGKDYGTVVMMLDEENNLNVYFGDNIGKSMENDDKKSWFDFLYQLRMFAMKNLFSFSLQNLNKLKYSMQGQAALKEGLFESWSGTKTKSWNGVETEARLMIKHKRAIGENDARFRYVDSLFVETAEGERYKLPFTKLSAGRAMLEHVRQGGKPYDIRGQHISTIVEEMNLLSRFKKANQGKIFEGETQQLVEQATQYYDTLQNNLKSLSSKNGYKKYFEHVIIEDLRHMFIEQNIDSRIEQALPLLAKLQKEQNMKEVSIFENWSNLILEGTWAIPDTKEKQSALVKLLSQELPVGADATNVEELLYDLLGDDELFDRLEELAEQDADADAREIILTRLEELKDNHDIAQVIGQLKNPNPDSNEPIAQEPVDEGFEEGTSPVESAIINRIMRAHPDLLAKFGPKAVMTAARDQAEWIGDVEEIGSSDVSGWVNNIVKDLESNTQELDELSPDTLKSYVKKASSDRAMRNFDQGVDAGTSMNDRELKFDKENSRKDDQRRHGIHKAVNRLEESAMSEVDLLLQDIARGNVDIYDIYANPKTNVEKFVSDQIHDRVEELGHERPDLHHDDDIEKILQIIFDDLGDEYGVDEGTIGKGLGLIAGELLAPEIPGSGAVGAHIGDKIGDKIGDMFSKNKDMDETVGGGNWLEETDAIVDQMKKTQDEIEKIVRTGGRVGLNDPLSAKLKMLKNKLHKSKGVNENTALTGPYGHSGKMEPVEGVDEDMMSRIKFLAGIRETDATTETQENSNLTTMKSISSIFIR